MPVISAADVLFSSRSDGLKFHILPGMPQIKLNILFWHKILGLFSHSPPVDAG